MNSAKLIIFVFSIFHIFYIDQVEGWFTAVTGVAKVSLFVAEQMQKRKEAARKKKLEAERKKLEALKADQGGEAHKEVEENEHEKSSHHEKGEGENSEKSEDEEGNKKMVKNKESDGTTKIKKDSNSTPPSTAISKPSTISTGNPRSSAPIRSCAQYPIQPPKSSDLRLQCHLVVE